MDQEINLSTWAVEMKKQEGRRAGHM